MNWRETVDDTDDSVHIDSESDNRKEWVNDVNVLSEEGKLLIKKQRKILKHKVARRIAKEITMSCLLKRKLP